MASSSSQVDRNEVDIVCGALIAKLQTKNLSSGSSRCISFDGRFSHLVNSSAMLVNHHLETGNLRFAAVENCCQDLLKRV